MPNRQPQELPIVVQENIQLVDAQLLHRELKSTGRFRDWVNYRIKEYGFEEGKDFIAEKVRSNQKGQPQINYLLTLDMAKELAMLERNETGRAIRRYFIAKEKELRGISQLPKESQLLKGISTEKVNGRKLFAYKEVRERCGYSTKGSSNNHKLKYPQHFVLMGKLLFVTEEFALHLHHSRQVVNNRAALKEMQPVLPFDFGTQIQGGAA